MLATPTLLAIGIPLILVGGVFWMWMRALHNEIGPSVIATVISIGAVVAMMGVAMKLMEPAPPPPPINWDEE